MFWHSPPTSMTAGALTKCICEWIACCRAMWRPRSGVHWCDESATMERWNLQSPNIDFTYQAFSVGMADFSLYSTIPVALSLPGSNATGTPGISGTATVGETLTATIGDIADANGLPSSGFPSGYTFQWVRVDTDGTSNPAEIESATSSTYTLTEEDAGKKVKVQVGFTAAIPTTLKVSL